MDVRRILAIQLRELGDTLLMTPLLRQMQRLHPGARIDVLCQNSNRVILAHNEHVCQLMELRRRAPPAEFLRVAWQLRRRSYDMVVDSQGLPKTALLTRLIGARRRMGVRRRWLRNRLCYTHLLAEGEPQYSAQLKLRLLQDDRVDLGDLRLEFPTSLSDREEASRFRARWFRGRVVALCGVSRFAERLWPAPKLAEIGDRLAGYGFQIFLIYGPGQEEMAGGIASRMRCHPLVDYPVPSLPVLKEILAACTLVVGNDGGPKHVAVSAGVPTVTVFDGPSAVCWTPPGRPEHRVVAAGLPPWQPNVAGRFVDVRRIADIPVDAVWEQVQIALQHASLPGLGRTA